MMDKRHILCSIFIFMVWFSVAGQDMQEFFCIDLAGIPNVGASLRLEQEDNWKKYHEANLFDGDGNTAWVEGVPGHGIGEKLWFAMEPDTQELIIINGYAKNASLFAKNGRVRRFAFSLWAACTQEGWATEIGPLYEGIKLCGDFEVPLKDTAERQIVILPVDWREAALGLTDFADEYSARSQGMWESIVFTWNPQEQRYSSFLHGSPFDTGSWSFTGGRLILESDGRGMTREYPEAEITAGRLVLKDDAGSRVEYGRD